MTSQLYLLLAAGLAGTLAIEALLTPRPRPFWRRGMAAANVHLGSWLLTFGALFAVLQRPGLAVVVLLALQLVVVQSSNTKSQTLNEPFICHDFEYFWDAIRHPRLYVPFFGIGLAVAASLTALLAIGAFFYWEASWLGQHGGRAFLTLCGVLCGSGAALVALGVRRLDAITLCPNRDLEALGLYASLWAYGVALMRSSAPSPDASPFYHHGDRHDAHQDAHNDSHQDAHQRQAAPAVKTAALAHTVLVQSESFSDPRSWCADVADDLLPHWDHAARQAPQQGSLHVPAWGANTVRTECAVLTGLTPEQWGIRQFNPYRSLARRNFPSLAASFKRAGYRTVCVHPYSASFYFRHRVMPQLGFDSFVDVENFSSDDRNGQYIGDAAVAQKVAALLDDADDTPLFIFVITMENHGPLELEQPRHDALANTLPRAPWPLPQHQRNLAVYLRHLRQADAMLDTLTRALSRGARPGVLGWYGDHVPILPDAYAYYSAPTGKTPYLLWSSQQQQRDTHSTTPQRLAANELGNVLLQHVWQAASGRQGHTEASEYQ